MGLDRKYTVESKKLDMDKISGQCLLDVASYFKDIHLKHPQNTVNILGDEFGVSSMEIKYEVVESDSSYQKRVDESNRNKRIIAIKKESDLLVDLRSKLKTYNLDPTGSVTTNINGELTRLREDRKSI